MSLLPKAQRRRAIAASPRKPDRPDKPVVRSVPLPSEDTHPQTSGENGMSRRALVASRGAPDAVPLSSLLTPPVLPFALPEIIAPTFPARAFDIRDFGAREDVPEADCTRAFANAIESCSSAGGGRVLVPPGT